MGCAPFSLPVAGWAGGGCLSRLPIKNCKGWKGKCQPFLLNFHEEEAGSPPAGAGGLLNLDENESS